jgi:hypothetical protein
MTCDTDTEINNKLEEIKINDNQCSICLEELDENSMFELECKHTFHAKCIVGWFRTTDKKTCPMCRDDPNKVKETNLQEDVEQLFDLLHQHEDVPEVAQILQLEDQVRARQYDSNFYYRVCGVLGSFIPLTSKLKLVSILFLIGAATTISTPLIAGGLIINSTVRGIGSGISYLVNGGRSNRTRIRQNTGEQVGEAAEQVGETTTETQTQTQPVT